MTSQVQGADRWLLLLHHLPPKPPYFRAKVARRLAQLGALPLKNAAYLLPDQEDTLEDFEWLVQEIQKDGGGCWLFRVDLLAGHTSSQIETAFRNLRAPDYEGLLQDLIDTSQLSHEQLRQAVPRLTRRYQQIRTIDFLDSPLRTRVEEVINALQAQLRETEVTTALPVHHGRTWVTRQGVKVDRISSAWLIRCFIDPEARFRFVDPERYSHQPGELRFDMFQGEFTHRGEMCTFEVLLSDFQLASDPGLTAIAEMVHDIDLRDDRFHRPETAGLARMLDGLYRRISSDTDRLEAAESILYSLYESLRQ